ncbi:hypothetical protein YASMINEVIRUS_588 [Yasminevirus sp. GU-2018]|uniref:Uncharacterized protein n=1 Tax=Yasminevirus sp. GU-2018 TaxID=2420051 RepID=A0A5K0U8L0_9VIRU|nr:hypothetical protein YASMINEVIRUS_588 [Yasminevirus sp. GU-2018]
MSSQHTSQQTLQKAPNEKKSPLKVGDRVVVKMLCSEPIPGTVIGSWSGSLEEASSGRYGLDKWNVAYDEGYNVQGTTWVYKCDIKKM